MVVLGPGPSRRGRVDRGRVVAMHLRRSGSAGSHGETGGVRGRSRADRPGGDGRCNSLGGKRNRTRFARPDRAVGGTRRCGGDGAVGAHLETWPRHHSTDRATVLPRSAVHLEAAPGTPHRFERSCVARIGAPPDHSLRRPVRSCLGDCMPRGCGNYWQRIWSPPQASGQ